MKKFNRDKALRELEFKKNRKKYVKYVSIVIPCFVIVISAIYFAYSKFFTSSEIEVVRTTVGDFIYGDVVIASYIDGKYSADFPSKGSVVFDYVECGDGTWFDSIGRWDNDAWGLLITNMTKRTKCNVYFNSFVSDKIIASVDTTGKCPIVNEDGTVSISNIEDGPGYVCSAPDRFGTSYYYRGNVKNNNVSFAGFFWQIIRINGDGSIRLMYNGTTPNATGINQSINATGYAFNTEYTNPAYVGYMYGNTIGTRENNIKNEVNSTIKTAVDSWYKTNIQNDFDSTYIVDAGFCNDRSLSSGDGAKTDEFTDYGALGRFRRNVATLNCQNESSDLFTLNTTSFGNKALTYPVGLITYDELIFAGMDADYSNKLSWVYSNAHYWTMSPSDYNSTDGRAGEWGQSSEGYSYAWIWVNGSHGVRPVINIKGDSLISGDGSMDNPYKTYIDAT